MRRDVENGVHSRAGRVALTPVFPIENRPAVSAGVNGRPTALREVLAVKRAAEGDVSTHSSGIAFPADGHTSTPPGSGGEPLVVSPRSRSSEAPRGRQCSSRTMTAPRPASASMQSCGECMERLTDFLDTPMIEFTLRGR